MIYLFLFLSGVVGGILAGLFGIGGGLIYTFIIPVFLRWKYPELEFTSEIIIANSIVGVLFASLSSSIQLIKDKLLPYKQVLTGSAFAITSSFISSYFIVGEDWYSQTVFRTVIMVLILIIAIRLLFVQKDSILRKEKPFDMPIVGVFGGIISALSGFGGGVVMVPMLLFSKVFDIHKAKNISLGIIAINSFFLALRALLKPAIPAIENSIGLVLPIMCVCILTGTIIGGPIGIRLAKKINKQKLLKLYLALLSVLMIYYLCQVI